MPPPEAEGCQCLWAFSEVSAINRVVMPRKTSAVGIKAERRWKSAVTHVQRIQYKGTKER